MTYLCGASFITYSKVHLNSYLNDLIHFKFFGMKRRHLIKFVHNSNLS